MILDSLAEIREKGESLMSLRGFTDLSTTWLRDVHKTRVKPGGMGNRGEASGNRLPYCGVYARNVPHCRGGSQPVLVGVTSGSLTIGVTPVNAPP